MMNNKVVLPQVVTIAGSDSGGGAGMQADLKTFQARNVFGLSIVVALTAQNTIGVQETYPISCSFIDRQFQSLASDFSIKAVKTGMLADREHVECVVRNLKKYSFGPLVVDPVMIAKGGYPLLKEEAVDSIRKELLGLATIVTPNIPEAEVLAEMRIQSEKDCRKAADRIKMFGVKHVVIKGGHSEGVFSKDYVSLSSGEEMWLVAPRISTKNTHGTGDTFSACIAAQLAKGDSLQQALIVSKRFIQGAIVQQIQVGHGHGPTNHWATLSEDVFVE